MQDASAKYPRLGLLEGHQHFPGNFQSCLEIKTGDKVIGDGKHCMMLGVYPGLASDGERELTQGELRSIIKGERFCRHLVNNCTFLYLEQNTRGLFFQVIANGFLTMGRCVPSACDRDDVQAGWVNFFSDTGLINTGLLYPFVLNCHTEDEEGNIVIVRPKYVCQSQFKRNV